MPEDLDAALLASVRAVLPASADVAKGRHWHWRPDGEGRWSSPAARRLAAPAGMPVAALAARLAAALGAGLTERLGPATGRAVVVVGGGSLAVTPGPEDLAAVVSTILGAGPAYGRPARPVPCVVVDLTVLQRRTPDNLLFVVMWAHARCCVILDRAGTADGTPTPATATLTARVLVLLLADLPRALAAAGDDPAAVLRRLHELGAATHGWLDERDVRGPGPLALVDAARQVLATGLDVLGLPAPTRL